MLGERNQEGSGEPSLTKKISTFGIGMQGVSGAGDCGKGH
jgi:hypothetical protein